MKDRKRMCTDPKLPPGDSNSSFSQRTLRETGNCLAKWSQQIAEQPDERAGYEAWRIGRAADTLFYDADCIDALELDPLFASLEVRGNSIVSILQGVEHHIARKVGDRGSVTSVVEMIRELDQVVAHYREPFMLKLHATRLLDWVAM